MSEINPELVLLKWAYKRGVIDDDQLHDFHVRVRRERPSKGYLELALEWEVLDRDQVRALLDPGAIAAGVEEGLIDSSNARALERVEID